MQSQCSVGPTLGNGPTFPSERSERRDCSAENVSLCVCVCVCVCVSGPSLELSPTSLQGGLPLPRKCTSPPSPKVVVCKVCPCHPLVTPCCTDGTTGLTFYSRTLQLFVSLSGFKCPTFLTRVAPRQLHSREKRNRAHLVQP